MRNLIKKILNEVKSPSTLTPYEDVKGEVLYKLGSIPIDKQEAPSVIKLVLGGNRYKLFNDVDLTELKLRNRVRFSAYFETFNKAKQYGRGHMWEGLFAGLFGGNVSSGGDIRAKSDVMIDGEGYSLKFLNNRNERPTLGNMTSFIKSEGLKELSITDIFGSKETLRIDKKDILDAGFSGIDYWVFGVNDEENRTITVRYITNDKLKELILDNPNHIVKPRRGGDKGELRLSSTALKKMEKFTIKFPSVSQEDYKKYLHQGPREKEISNLFTHHGKKLDPDTISYIRKNPQEFIKKLHTIYGDKFNLGLEF